LPTGSLLFCESAIATRFHHQLPRRDFHPQVYQRTKAAPRVDPVPPKLSTSWDRASGVSDRCPESVTGYENYGDPECDPVLLEIGSLSGPDSCLTSDLIRIRQECRWWDGYPTSHPRRFVARSPWEEWIASSVFVRPEISPAS